MKNLYHWIFKARSNWKYFQIKIFSVCKLLWVVYGPYIETCTSAFMYVLGLEGELTLSLSALLLERQFLSLLPPLPPHNPLNKLYTKEKDPGEFSVL